VNVSTETGVIREIPTEVIGVVIDHDLIAAPVPGRDIGHVKCGNAPVEIIEPKSIRVTATQHPHMSAAESAREAAVRIGMIQMEAAIVAALVVSDPSVV